MGVVANCGCGASYTLKDEFAGRRVKCPSCGGAIEVGAAAVAVIEGDPAFARDKFLLRQKALAIKSKYYVWDEQGQPILYVERPAYFGRSLLAALAAILAGVVVGGVLGAGAATVLSEDAFAVAMIPVALLAIGTIIAVAVALSPLRHITFYRDDTKQEALLEIAQQNKWQVPNAYYELREMDGTVLARFKKNYLYNFIRRRWYVKRPDDSMLCLAKEDSILLSLLRRLLGDLGKFIRTNFVILRPEDERVIGEFNRKFTLLDRYVLDMSADSEQHLDRRIALALGVLLDTGEKR